MRKTEKYRCDLCDEEFDTEEKCREHEAKHYTNWEKVGNKKIAGAAYNLGAVKKGGTK